jgi:hypothetical protein
VATKRLKVRCAAPTHLHVVPAREARGGGQHRPQALRGDELDQLLPRVFIQELKVLAQHAGLRGVQDAALHEARGEALLAQPDHLHQLPAFKGVRARVERDHGRRWRRWRRRRRCVRHGVALLRKRHRVGCDLSVRVARQRCSCCVR